jgi:hypothetical protein
VSSGLLSPTDGQEYGDDQQHLIELEDPGNRVVENIAAAYVHGGADYHHGDRGRGNEAKDHIDLLEPARKVLHLAKYLPLGGQPERIRASARLPSSCHRYYFFSYFA